MNNLEKIIRNFENTRYYGYMFFVSYNGSLFDSFDENPNMKSVKSEFRKMLKNHKIEIFKGIQQAGRTDRNVNAKENILYINCKKNIDILETVNEINNEGYDIKISNIKKTLPFLEFPGMIEKRLYIYEYPENLTKNNDEKIRSLCMELSGKKNFKKFTSKKGKKLKEHTRNIKIKYENKKLYFEGDGFLPQQVRIMSSFILNNSMMPLEGKYLTLEKVKLSWDLENIIFFDEKTIKIDKVERIEKNTFFYIFYTDKKNKSEIIGKKGKNIKKLKKIYGNIVIKEI